MRNNGFEHENIDLDASRATSTIEQFVNPLVADASTTIHVAQTTFQSGVSTAISTTHIAVQSLIERVYVPPFELTRQHSWHSLSGHPLPDASILTAAPPPSTLCPHAIEHKFPHGHKFMESTEEFLKSCRFQASSLADLECLSNISLGVNVDRIHSLGRNNLPEVFLDATQSQDIFLDQT